MRILRRIVDKIENIRTEKKKGNKSPENYPVLNQCKSASVFSSWKRVNISKRCLRIKRKRKNFCCFFYSQIDEPKTIQLKDLAKKNLKKLREKKLN